MYYHWIKGIAPDEARIGLGRKRVRFSGLPFGCINKEIYVYIHIYIYTEVMYPIIKGIYWGFTGKMDDNGTENGNYNLGLRVTFKGTA